jgi:hypothetical protein
MALQSTSSPPLQGPSMGAPNHKASVRIPTRTLNRLLYSAILMCPVTATPHVQSTVRRQSPAIGPVMHP